MATIKQAAEALNVQPKKLLNEIKKKFPEQTWTLDSELPDGFEEAAKQHAQEYAEASGVELPKGELTNTNEAVADSRIILESLEYGIQEALSDSKMQSLITSAQLSAVSHIQQYENAYSQVWEMYFNQEIARQDKRSEELAQNLKQTAIALNNDLGKRRGELIAAQQRLMKLQQESKALSQEILKSLLG